MNPIYEFLFFDVDFIANIQNSFLRSLLAVVVFYHTITWYLVLLLLPFKLLSWIISGNKKVK